MPGKKGCFGRRKWKQDVAVVGPFSLTNQNQESEAFNMHQKGGSQSSGKFNVAASPDIKKTDVAVVGPFSLTNQNQESEAFGIYAAAALYRVCTECCTLHVFRFDTRGLEVSFVVIST